MNGTLPSSDVRMDPLMHFPINVLRCVKLIMHFSCGCAKIIRNANQSVMRNGRLFHQIVYILSMTSYENESNHIYFFTQTLVLGIIREYNFALS